MNGIRSVQAYLINGPCHGDIRVISEDQNRRGDLRIAAPPQTQHWSKSDPWSPEMKTGIYQRSHPLMFDPINHKVEQYPTCFIYEWKGWE